YRPVPAAGPHSFPARRSSDLSPDDLAGIGLAPGDVVTLRIGAGIHNIKWVQAYGDVEEGEPLLHVDSAGLMAIAVRDGRADEHLDRKSTRLNSSHVKISYAVF